MKIYTKKTTRKNPKTFAVGFLGLAALAFPPLVIPGILTVAGGSLGLVDDIYKAQQISAHEHSNGNRQLKRNAEIIDALALIGAPFLIEIEPISKPSRIDDKVLVSKFRWAVTLICYNGSDGNHTSIIVEGLNDGEFKGLKYVTVGNYFMYKSEFCNTNLIKSKQFTSDLEIDQRTQVWKVSSGKAVRLLKNIKKQKKRIKKGLENLNFL